MLSCMSNINAEGCWTSWMFCSLVWPSMCDLQHDASCSRFTSRTRRNNNPPHYLPKRPESENEYPVVSSPHFDPLTKAWLFLARAIITQPVENASPNCFILPHRGLVETQVQKTQLPLLSTIPRYMCLPSLYPSKVVPSSRSSETEHFPFIS